MSTVISIDQNHEAHHDQDHNESSLRTFGFWIFLISDLILFATLFATFIILKTRYNGGPTGAELFSVPIFTAETFILLTSSFTSGLAVLSLNSGKIKNTIVWLVITILLGMTFVGLEITEFVSMIHEGATISASAFLSAFFVLVGTHGLHVSVGIVWMIGATFQLWRYGIHSTTTRKVNIVSLYWHFLDVVWIFIFTVVYLMGVM